MSDDPNGPTRPSAIDERLYDERMRFFRPGRLIAGLVMIAVAVIWLVVQNAFGLEPKQSPPGAIGTPTPAIPRLGATQHFTGGTANALVLGRTNHLDGRTAPSGSSFLVVAVQVTNHRTSPLRVSAGDVTLYAQGRKLGAGVIATGHGAVFTPKGIPPGKAADGDLEFTVRNSAESLVLAYLPRVPNAVPLKWSVPAS
jgi:hypothetical protein